MDSSYIVPIVVILLLLPFLAYALATRSIFYTFVQRGSIKFVKAGESPVKILYDLDGYKLENDKFIKTTEKQRRPFLGIFKVGLPPFKQVHKFIIKKVKENIRGSSPQEWITEETEEMVSELRFKIPRPYVFWDVELGSGAGVTILVTVMFRVVAPLIPVFDLKGAFFENLGGDLNAEITSKLQEYSLKGEDGLPSFTKVKKSGTTGILGYLMDEKHEFNQSIAKAFGLVIEDISISQAAPSGGEEQQKALSAKATAILLGEAKIATADAEAQALLKTAQAEQKRLEMLGLLEIKRGKITLIPDARTKAFTDALSKLTELRVLGEGAMPLVDVSSERKREE